MLRQWRPTFAVCMFTETHQRRTIMGELDGRSVIVTGAAHGIGAGIADVLAREGAQLVVTDLDFDGVQATAARIATSGGTAVPVAHDVTDSGSCVDVVAQTNDAFGRVDALVNNAGISQRLPFTDIDEPTWDRMLDINVKGVFLMTQAVVRDMLPRDGGAIVNNASLIGKAGALPLFVHYVASKFAVVGLTQAVAAELAP